MPEHGRDPGAVGGRLADWLRHRHPSWGVEVVVAAGATGGYSSDVVLVTLRVSDAEGPPERTLVVRLPPRAPGLFPTYDLRAQAAVQEVVRAAGVPVPEFATVEPDPDWMGEPFLLMPFVPGAVPGELASVDQWVIGLGRSAQARLQEGFLRTLAQVHATDWEGTPLVDCLPGAAGTLADDLARWDDFVAWAFDGSPPVPLADGFAWCRANLPGEQPPRSLLWGDVRLGNVIFGDDLAPRALLDWEMAAIGPAESDLAWYTVLDEVGNHLAGRTVPGFLDRDAVLATHEAGIGRPLVAFRWFEIVALWRSAALNIRAARLAAARQGGAAPPAEKDPVLRYATRVTEAA